MSQTTRHAAEQHFKNGVHCLKQNDFAGARAAFDRAIELMPQFGEAWMFRGALKINHLDNLESGIADCTEALRFLPQHPMAHANRGIAYLKLEKYSLAIEDFRIALNTNPLDGNLHRMKAYCHYKLEQYDQAVLHYSGCIRFWHDQALAHDMRGVCYFCLHEFENALADFNESIRLKPDRPAAYTNRGILYTRRGEYENALADHNRALSFQEMPSFFSNRGLVYLMQHDLDRAMADCEKALALDAHFADAYGLCGQIHFVRGRLKAALADFKRMEDYKESGDGHALAGQSITVHAMGYPDQALNVWQYLVGKNPHYGDLRWIEDEFLLAAPLMAEVYKIVAALPQK